MIRQLICSLLIIFIGLISGYIVQILVQRNILHTPFSLEEIKTFLQKLSIFFFITMIYIGVYWSMDFHQLKLLLFPLLGVFNLFLGGGIAVLVTRLTHMYNKDSGSFFCCGFLLIKRTGDGSPFFLLSYYQKSLNNRRKCRA